MSLYVHPSAARTLACMTPNSMWPAIYTSDCIRFHLSKEPNMAWNLLWTYPINLTGSSISLALELIAITVHLIAAPILTIIGLATKSPRIRSQRLQNAKAIALLSVVLTNVFFLTVINILCPGVNLYRYYDNTMTGITGIASNNSSDSDSDSDSSDSEIIASKYARKQTSPQEEKTPPQ